MTDPSQRSKSLVTVRLAFLVLAGFVGAAGLSYLVADRQWQKADREHAALRVQADDSLEKQAQARRVFIPGESPDGRRLYIAPMVGPPQLSGVVVERLDALEWRGQLLLYRRDVASRLAVGDAVACAALLLAYWFLQKHGPDHPTEPLSPSRMVYTKDAKTRTPAR